jgi:hypothetical protein
MNQLHMNQNRKKESNSVNYIIDLLDGSYKPGSIYKIGNIALDPLDLLGGITAEKARDLYNTNLQGQGLYIRSPSDFENDPITRETKPKREVQNIIYNGCP